MLIARFWDMASDPLMGIISDRTRTRWGKFRPTFSSAPSPTRAGRPDLHHAGPRGDGPGHLCGATYVLLMTAYTAINLPYSSLSAVMTPDIYERAGLNTYRFICAFAGQFWSPVWPSRWPSSSAGATRRWAPVHRDPVWHPQRDLFFITFATTRERGAALHGQPSSIKADLRNLFRNRPWIILACVGVISFIMFAMQNAAIAYYFKYYVGNEENVQLFNVIGTVALIVALPFSKPLAKRFGNRNVFIASSLISGIFFMALYLPGQKDLVTIYILNILAKMTYAPAVPLIWTMMADTADYSEWKTGRRATGCTSPPPPSRRRPDGASAPRSRAGCWRLRISCRPSRRPQPR